MKFLVLLVFILLLTPIPVSNVSSCLQVRGVFDIGSGATRLQVAKVDVCQKKVFATLYSGQYKVSYKEDLENSSDQAFSEATMEKGLHSLTRLKDKAGFGDEIEYLGVASASFRQALNGPQFSKKIEEKLKMQVKVVTPEIEGVLGFKGVLAIGSSLPDASSIVVWDVGGGSEQLTRYESNQYKVHSDTFASVSFKNMLTRATKDPSLRLTSPNPIGLKNIEKSVRLAQENFRKNIPADWSDRLGNANTYLVGIGAVHNYSILGQVGINGTIYSLEDLHKTIVKRVEYTDGDLKSDYAATEVANLIYVYSFMDLFHIEKIEVVKVNLTDAVLTGGL